MSNGLIYVGIPRERMYLPAFVDNRDAVLAQLNDAGRACGYYQAEGHRVDRNRDRIVEQFLSRKDKPEWLLMLDSDMEHPPTCGLRLSALGQPVAGALYFHRGLDHQPMVFKRIDPPEADRYGRLIQMYAPMYDEVYEFLERYNVPMRDGSFTLDGAEDALLEADAIGSGCMLIRRDVLEALKPPWFEYRKGWSSEDLEFCERVKGELGLPVFVDMSTVCGHFQHMAMGQAQFRMKYRGRGIARTNYTPSDAVRWLSEFMGWSVEEARARLEGYQTEQLTQLWQEKLQAESELDWYNRQDVGEMYLLDLLHWNGSQVFARFRDMLMGQRGQRILEIGGGIGTMSMQLALQDNQVDMVEPNDVLRRFAEYRWKEIGADGLRFHDELPGPVPGMVDNGRYDLLVAVDVFEHMPKEQLPHVLYGISNLLKRRARMFAHNNWKQQDIYPMHHDHSQWWPAWLGQADLFPLDELWSVKIR